MTQKKEKDIAASVLQRLLNRARANKEDFNHLLNRYGMERFLYRLSVSSYSEEFILKGASLFLVWQEQSYRVTKDADFLSFGDPSLGRLSEIFIEICDIECPVKDGILFLPESVKALAIREEQAYDGVGISLSGALNKARVSLQIDVGFGDIVTPSPEMIDYPSLLEFPKPKLRAYSKYSVVAEKVEAMVKLSMANSRMKDFYDVWLLSKLDEFEYEILKQAVQNTFQRRETRIPIKQPVALTAEFYHDSQKQQQWKAFIRKSKIKDKPEDLESLVVELSTFIMPVFQQNTKGSDRYVWVPGKDWINN